jgi:hypothetical protein
MARAFIIRGGWDSMTVRSRTIFSCVTWAVYFLVPAITLVDKSSLGLGLIRFPILIHYPYALCDTVR